MNWESVRGVSRTFYWTLRLLPARVRHDAAVAYMIARLTDTLADLGELESARRLELLDQLQASLDGPAFELDPEILRLRPDRAAEGRLLMDAGYWIARYRESPRRRLIGDELLEILHGQRFDLSRFPSDEPLDEAELDHYADCVAGSAGRFLDRLCIDAFSRFRTRDAGEPQAAAFGRGLQYLNILRDRAEDVAIGRIYIPDARVSGGIATCFDYLDAGSRYAAAVRIARVRFAFALPLFLAGRTLNRLADSQGRERIRLSRQDVYKTMFEALPVLASAKAVTARWNTLRTAKPM